MAADFVSCPSEGFQASRCARNSVDNRYHILDRFLRMRLRRRRDLPLTAQSERIARDSLDLCRSLVGGITVLYWDYGPIHGGLTSMAIFKGQTAVVTRATVNLTQDDDLNLLVEGIRTEHRNIRQSRSQWAVLSHGHHHVIGSMFSFVSVPNLAGYGRFDIRAH